jgi:cyanophycin synthetase
VSNDTIVRIEPPRGAPVSFLPSHRAAPTLLASNILRGCNVHHASTVIRQEIDLGGLAGVHSNQAGTDFAARFLERFFEMRRLVPDSSMPPSFIERLRLPAGVPLGEVLLEAIIAVETAMAFHRHDFYPIGFSTVAESGSPRTALLVWECKVPGISRAAARIGFAGCLELLPEELYPHQREGAEEFATALAKLEDRARRGERSTTAAVLALAARRRDLPCETLSGPYLRLGQGASQHMIYASATEDTSLPASQLARNKYRTNRLLAEQHLPIARQIKVATAADALAAAERLSYPVVIKPLKQKQAIGVTVGVAGPAQVAAAFARAEQASQRAGQRVIVEQFLRGQAHRLLVVGGRYIAALMTMPATITGDGVRSIAELIEGLNRDSMRDGVRLFKVPVNDHLVHDLERRGYRFGDVLPKGQTIELHSAANVAIGGLHRDVTDSVHPDNREMAIRATRAIGLNVAGVDFVTEDISRSYKDVGGGIIEVNARPGLCMHTFPRFGEPRPVAAAVLELVFPSGTTGRIPIAVIAGRRRTVRVTRDLDAMLRASGRTVALATRRGYFVDGKSAHLDRAQPHKAIASLLRDERLQMLISCQSVRRTVNHGLGLDSCGVAAITDRHIDPSYEDLFRQGLDVIARAARGNLVLSAENKLALEALSAFEPKRLILVASNADDPAIAAHRAAGGAFVTNVPGKQKNRPRVVLQREHEVLVSVPIASARSKPGAPHAARRRMQARMFVVALAFAMGLSSTDIKAALRSRK